MKSVLLEPALWILLLCIEIGWILAFHLGFDSQLGIISGVVIGYLLAVTLPDVVKSIKKHGSS